MARVFPSLIAFSFVNVMVTTEDPALDSLFGHCRSWLKIGFHYDPRAQDALPAAGPRNEEQWRATDVIEPSELLPDVAECLKVSDVLAAVAGMWGMDVLTDYSRPSTPSDRSRLPTFSAFAPLLSAFKPQVCLRDGRTWRTLTPDEEAMSLAEFLRHMQPLEVPEPQEHLIRNHLTLAITLPKSQLNLEAVRAAADALRSEAAAKTEPKAGRSPDNKDKAESEQRARSREQERARRREQERARRREQERASLVTKTMRPSDTLLRYRLLTADGSAWRPPKCAVTGILHRFCQASRFIPEHVGEGQLMAALRAMEKGRRALVTRLPKDVGPRAFSAMRNAGQVWKSEAFAFNYCLGDARLGELIAADLWSPRKLPFPDELVECTGWFLAPHLARSFDHYSWLVTPRGHALHLVDADSPLDLAQEIKLCPLAAEGGQMPADPPSHEADRHWHKSRGQAFGIPLLNVEMYPRELTILRLPSLHMASLSTLFALFPGHHALITIHAAMCKLDLSLEAFPNQAEEEEQDTLYAIRNPEGRSQLNRGTDRVALALGWFAATSGASVGADESEGEDDGSDAWSLDSGPMRDRTWSKAALDDLQAKEALMERRQSQRDAIVWFSLMRRAHAEAHKL